MTLRRGVAFAQALLPWACSLHLPRLMSTKTLEQDVDGTLPLVVGATVALSLLLSTALSPAPSAIATKLGRGIIGQLVGTVLFHVVIVIFGAPVEVLVTRTALLAALLASVSAVPLAVHVGLSWRDWVDVVLNVRARNEMEVHAASLCIGASLGAYLGALPIPLDWDRPWQQWPLTCLYGSLGGTTLGSVAGVAIIEWMKKRKTE